MQKNTKQKSHSHLRECLLSWLCLSFRTAEIVQCRASCSLLCPPTLTNVLKGAFVANTLEQLQKKTAELRETIFVRISVF